MTLGARDAARLLNVSETALYRWVDADEIPFVMIQHRPTFHRVELLEWAIENDLPLATDLYENGGEAPLAAALDRGGGQVLTGGLAGLALEDAVPDAGDRDVLRAVIAARASEMFVVRTTEAIAVPRARSPIVRAGPPQVVLARLLHSTTILGGAPVSAVFLILSPTVAEHLKLLSRLALALHDRDLRAAVVEPAAFAHVLDAVRRFEAGLAEAGLRRPR